LISVRLQTETIKAIDRWAKRDDITRSERRRLLKGERLKGRGATEGDAVIDSRTQVVVIRCRAPLHLYNALGALSLEVAMAAAAAQLDIELKRAYEPHSASDGSRILIDRLWPRVVTKKAAAIDHWFRDLAPSTELRQWFGHDLKPLERNSVPLHRRAQASKGPVFGARDEAQDAVVLRHVLLGDSKRRVSQT
jgi:Protein of unknown function, DUF488